MKDLLRLKINFWGLLSAAGSLVCVLTLTAFLGRFWWVFDLTVHFRVQYLASLILISAAFIIGRRFKTALVFSAFAVLNGILVLPYFYSGRASVAPAAKTLRVLKINVRTENQQHGLVTKFIIESSADLVLLEEVNDEWMENLAALQTNYPHVCQQPRDDNFGIALFSKLPLENPEIVYPGNADVPSVTAEITFAGKPIKILGTHPLPPASRENTVLRNQQLAAIPGLLAPWKGGVILLGDLNTTPWSPHFKKLVRTTSLTDSGRGFGWQTTWPAHFFPLRIAIDHCLLSADLRAVSRTVGPNVGSDHLPLVVKIAVE